MAGVRVDGQPVQAGQAQPRFGDSGGAQTAEDPLGGLTESEAALRLNARDRQSLEQRLRSLGFEPGPIDGQIDARARAAIRGFQVSRGMQASGQLDRQTVVGIVQTTNQSRQDGLITEGTDVVRALIESLDAPESAQ
jgi:peptidoglycan hydrolase-like protein with peptidoglycan-binding domain